MKTARNNIQTTVVAQNNKITHKTIKTLLITIITSPTNKIMIPKLHI